MTSVFSRQNSISLCPASFCTPRPNLPVTPCTSFFFFFMLQKALLFPFGPRLERGLQGVKKLPSSWREGLQATLMLGGFFKGHWYMEAPSGA